jgi:tRNA 5-methylaminomethyl-2-thiouridine biosynthesis bifunctional protein
VRSIVTRDDGAHARWHRAAALEAQRQLTPLVRAGLVAGRLQGLLHLGDDLEDMRRRLAALPLPADHVQALDAVQATALAGLVQAGHVAATDAPGAGANLGPAWFFPAGGWVDPRTLVQHWLEHSKATLRLNCLTTQLQRHGGRWQACGPAGEIWAEADVVVLANAHGAASLAPAGCTSAWVLGRTRGQITRLSAAELSQCGLPHAPLLPLARNGYVIPLPDGSVLCGATQAADDDETGLRDGDHAHNLAVLRRLTGQGRTARDPAKDGPCAAPAMAALEGRVGWRCHSDDRLPLVGAAYSPTHPGRRLAATRLDQPRHVPREPGLFTLTALGSRGITHAALAAQVLAAWIVDAPMPIDTDLLDAVDAARPVSRATRKTQGR